MRKALGHMVIISEHIWSISHSPSSLILISRHGVGAGLALGEAALPINAVKPCSCYVPSPIRHVPTFETFTIELFPRQSSRCPSSNKLQQRQNLEAKAFSHTRQNVLTCFMSALIWPLPYVHCTVHGTKVLLVGVLCAGMTQAYRRARPGITLVAGVQQQVFFWIGGRYDVV